jgi:hypothetical protein
MAENVKITWHWVDFDPNTTRSNLKQQLVDISAPMTLIDRAVYVIRFKPPFAISYPDKYTPVLYIGEGDLINRLLAHREWTKRLLGLGYNFPLEVAFCCPRVKGNICAYQVFEAHLLKVFYERYGSLPLKNSIHENMAYDHQYDKIATSTVLGPGKGTRRTWSIQPLASNPFKAVFERTHEDRAA